MNLYDNDRQILSIFKNWLELKSKEDKFSENFFDEIDAFLNNIFENVD